MIKEAYDAGYNDAFEKLSVSAYALTEAIKNRAYKSGDIQMRHNLMGSPSAPKDVTTRQMAASANKPYGQLVNEVHGFNKATKGKTNLSPEHIGEAMMPLGKTERTVTRHSGGTPVIVSKIKSLFRRK